MSVSMLTDFGVMTLFTSAAHMVQNTSSGAESYTLEVQSNRVSNLTGVNLIVLDVPLDSLRPSMAWHGMADFVLCDQYNAQCFCFLNKLHEMLNVVEL